MTGPAGLATPSVARRFACLVYEVLVLFGVGLVCGAIGALLLAITGRPQDLVAGVLAFAVYGVYFVWFWHRHGQTLPMKTWHIRLVTADGGPVSRGRAVARYLAACAWIAPPALLWQGDHRLAATAAWAVAYGLSARLLPHRQFLHDLVCGTRLIDVKPAVPLPSTR